MRGCTDGTQHVGIVQMHAWCMKSPPSVEQMTRGFSDRHTVDTHGVMAIGHGLRVPIGYAPEGAVLRFLAPSPAEPNGIYQHTLPRYPMAKCSGMRQSVTAMPSRARHQAEDGTRLPALECTSFVRTPGAPIGMQSSCSDCLVAGLRSLQATSEQTQPSDAEGTAARFCKLEGASSPSVAVTCPGRPGSASPCRWNRG